MGWKSSSAAEPIVKRLFAKQAAQKRGNSALFLALSLAANGSLNRLIAFSLGRSRGFGRFIWRIKDRIVDRSRHLWQIQIHRTAPLAIVISPFLATAARTIFSKTVTTLRLITGAALFTRQRTALGRLELLLGELFDSRHKAAVARRLRASRLCPWRPLAPYDRCGARSLRHQTVRRS